MLVNEDRIDMYPYDVHSFLQEIMELHEILLRFTPDEVEKISESKEIVKFTWMLGYKPDSHAEGLLKGLGHLQANDFEERLKEK